MSLSKFMPASLPNHHPRGRAIVVITTFLVVLLLLGLAAAAYLFGPWTKPTAAKEVKKIDSPGISPRVLQAPSRPQSSSPRQEKGQPQR